MPLAPNLVPRALDQGFVLVPFLSVGVAITISIKSLFAGCVQTDWLDEQLGRLAPLLDARVLRRVARELWNSFAGVSYPETSFL